MPWNTATATAIGSMPGADPLETARVVAGELPELMPFPELPGRGVGADVVGRGAGLLVDIAVEVVPSGYRVTARPGRDHRRARDLLRRDLDAVEQAVAEAGPAQRTVKVQVAGPWTLASQIELGTGHRVLTDRGALRDFAESLVEGVAEHVREVGARTGASVLVQLDEPMLPSVLAGTVPTPSGYGTVPAVPEPEARRLLSEVIEAVGTVAHRPVAVHCCAARPPVALLRAAGAGVVSLDGTALAEVSGRFADELGEAWQEGVAFFLGLVPTAAHDESGELPVRALAEPAFALARRLGFHHRVLAEQVVPTPTCGLAGATPGWSRRALSASRALARLFAEEAHG